MANDFGLGGGGVSYDNDQRFRLWVVQIYFLIGVKVNRQVQLTRKVYLSRKYTHYIHFNYNFLTLFIDFSKDLKLFYWHLVFPQYILTKIKYILNNVYIIPLTKKQKFDQLFIVKNYWGGGGGVTTPQAPPSRHAPDFKPL